MMDGAADMNFDPDELKEVLKRIIYELQWDLKGFGCDLVVSSVIV